MTRLALPHRHGFAIPLPVRTRFAFRALLGIGGRRECRVRDAPAASRAKVKSTQVSHHRFTERVRHSLRDGFTAYSELSPVNGLCCHRHPQEACFPGT